MRQRHVVILYQHHLFGEAIGRILSKHERIRVDVLPVDSLSRAALDALHADAVILEQAPLAGDIKARLLDASPVLTLVVGAESNTAEVYEGHEVIEANATDIIARILDGRSRASAKRRATRSHTAGRRDAAQ